MENGETRTDAEPWPTDTSVMWSLDLGLSCPEIRTQENARSTESRAPLALAMAESR